jgi:anaerobic ribonucleoside-triphosphate reductase
MSTIIICPKCYYHKHFTMTRNGYFCPICGRRMVERSFEEMKIRKLTSDDLREEDEGLLR